MSRRLVFVTIWLLAGNALAAALFWLLLRVPESSALTLMLSVLVLVACGLVFAWVHGTALAAWRSGASFGGTAARGWTTVPAVVLGVLLFLACWWVTARASGWHAAYAGQIDAWIIARSGRSDTAWLHRATDGAIWLLRWGIGLTLSLSLSAWALGGGAAVARGAWVRFALDPRRWVAVALLVGLAIVLPWHWAYWRPRDLSLTLEPWFVAAKLGALAVLAAVAWALALRVVTPSEIRSGRD